MITTKYLTIMSDDVKMELEIVLCMNYWWKQLPYYGDDEDCTICMKSMIDKYVLKTPCEHFFHRDCIINEIIYGSIKCPDCYIKFENYNKNNHPEKIDDHYEIEEEWEYNTDDELIDDYAQDANGYSSDFQYISNYKRQSNDDDNHEPCWESFYS